MSIYQKVYGEIDRLRGKMTDFAQQLVQIPSLPGEEQTAQHFFAKKLRSLGVDVEILQSSLAELEHHPAFSDDGISFEERLNVVGTWPASSPTDSSRDGKPGELPGRSLILNGHMDVVPIGDPTLWRHPPWGGVIENGKLYGRGACDMKAGIAAAVFAVEALRNLHFQPAGKVVLESVIGEESGGVGTLTTLTRGVLCRCGDLDGAYPAALVSGACRGAQLPSSCPRPCDPREYEAFRRERSREISSSVHCHPGTRPRPPS